jgi:chromate reductase, NAD(P)H dehydrogenase (quinone)
MLNSAMEKRKKIMAICGSTRINSTNHRLIKAIAELSKDSFDIEIYNSIERLPQFNPDKDKENAPKEVLRFKRLLNGADGVIICTPEYAHGVPGSLKNAIDWTVGTGEFSNKPAMLITASTDGRYAHESLLETLRVIEAKNINHLQLLISFASPKISTLNQVTDVKTLVEIKTLLEIFEQTVNENAIKAG